MAYKRPRAEYEADLRAQQSPYVSYGTPLPPIDSDVRDDGSYVPVWKQEVTDERGRKRLHGAFTGGFSAGYFNTVGSKEGWTPSTFVSSRSNRHKDESTKARPEDFMDEEDLAEAAEKQTLQTQDSFSGIGSTSNDIKRQSLLIDILKSQGDTMGVKLLRRMGWREGEGIGPKSRRITDHQKALSTGPKNGEDDLVAPLSSSMIHFEKKNDRKGLGYEAEERLDGKAHAKSTENPTTHEAGSIASADDEDNKNANGQSVPRRGGFGVGILNEDDSDDGDAYSMGPQISYSKTIGGSKKKKKVAQSSKAQNAPSNPLLKSKPIYLSKKILQNRPALRKCHDGRYPLDGFILSAQTSGSKPLAGLNDNYSNPQAPPDWTSSRSTSSEISKTAQYQSTAEAAKASRLDPKARALMLGETPLPGKSVFDFLTPAARERLASTSGNKNLPLARSEIIPDTGPPVASTASSSATLVQPSLNKEVALAALGRGVGGWMPYAEDEKKRQRYRSFLQYHGGLRTQGPDRPSQMSREDWSRELTEFARAAEVFKPMTGSMASRFTSSTAATTTSKESSESKDPKDDSSIGGTKSEDPAEAAAKMGMFGAMTRSIHTFYPSRLLCKRFNIKPPAHVESHNGKHDPGDKQKGTDGEQSVPMQFTTAQSSGSNFEFAKAMETPSTRADEVTSSELGSIPFESTEGHSYVDVERNDALEGEKAGDAIFKAVFGSSDEEDE